MKKIGMLMLLLSATSCMGWIWQVGEARDRAAHFQPVDALVVANRIDKAWGNNPANRAMQHYRAEYLLQYTVDGQTHRHWEADSLNTTQRFRAEAVLGQMAPGATVKVYVDPANPRRMTMHLAGWQAYFGAIVFATLAILFGSAGSAMLTWFELKLKSKRSNTHVVYLS